MMEHLKRQATKISLPIMIVQGNNDKFVDPRGSQLLYDLATSEDKTIKFYDGFYHEVFNEPDNRLVLQDVKNWLDAHIGATQ